MSKTDGNKINYPHAGVLKLLPWLVSMMLHIILDFSDLFIGTGISLERMSPFHPILITDLN